jgi:hypothetical protein
VKEDEIGGACSMFGCGKIFQSEYLKGRGHLKDLGVDGRIIFTRDFWK